MRIYAILGILVILAGGGYYVNSLVSDLEKSKANNVLLNEAVESQEKTIKSLNEDFILAKEANAKIRAIAEAQSKEFQNLNEKFNVKANGQSRDLGSIARIKPALVNKIINTATVNVNRCFELATGAIKLKGEMNNECPQLINSIAD